MEMDDKKMEIIGQLMDELQGLMQHSPDDMSERLGRPKVASLEIEAHPMDGAGGMFGKSDDDSAGPDADDGDSDMPMGDDGMPMDDSPEAKLKSRLMKLRA